MSLRRIIEGLRPYPSLLLLGLPTATVEPLKLAAVALAGKGHWISGTVMIAACYVFSLLVVERLFAIVKPKLPTIPWFASGWGVFDCLGRVHSGSLGWVGFLGNRKHQTFTPG